MSELINLELDDLANKINQEHRECKAAIQAGLQHAVKAGDLLIEAKSKLEHGTWLPWLQENCEVSERTARAYMRVARYWPELSKTATVANLNFRGALKLLSEPKTEEPEEAYIIETIDELSRWLETLDYYNPDYAIWWCKNVLDGTDPRVRVVLKQEENKSLLYSQNEIAHASILLKRYMGKRLKTIDDEQYEAMEVGKLFEELMGRLDYATRRWEELGEDWGELTNVETIETLHLCHGVIDAADFCLGFVSASVEAKDQEEFFRGLDEIGAREGDDTDYRALHNRTLEYLQTGVWEPPFLLGVRVSNVCA